jgi:hypothetical protein
MALCLNIYYFECMTKNFTYILAPWSSHFIHIIITQNLGAFEITSQPPLTIHINEQNNSQKCFSNVIITG